MSAFDFLPVSPKIASVEGRVADHKDPLSPLFAPHAGRGRKDRKRWCKGKPGRKHVPVLTVSNQSSGEPCHEAGKWWFGSPWRCFHETRCATCGKILEHYVDRDPFACPDLPQKYRDNPELARFKR